MSEPRLIKKYPNRRLYDTEESRYVTLAEVKDLVMRGIDFKVVDSQSEEEITRAILLQIIMEQESGGHPLFTADMLARFIRFYGDTAQATFTAFLEQGLNFFIQQQRAMTEHMGDIWRTNPMEFWIRVGQQNMNLWREMEESYRRTSGIAGQDKNDKKP
ncbi:MAG TPA: polyhydroxyalkanoate synthesis repressor PhaR [Thiobacillaceae bacterium]|nr:polyhydroxyalkanoate synthesis repressor PhaR [Thiobacillaceae bacterium]